MPLWAAVFTFLAASLLPIQAALSGALNRAFDRPALVVCVSLAGSLITIVSVGLITGRLGLVSAERLSRAPLWAFPLGVCGAIFLLSQPIAMPRLGVALFSALSVTAQVTTALLLDHLGAFGLAQHDAAPGRILGVALMAVGMVLVARF